MDIKVTNLSRRGFAALVAAAGGGFLVGCGQQTDAPSAAEESYVPEEYDEAIEEVEEEEELGPLIKGLDGVSLEFAVDAEGEAPHNWIRAEVYSKCYIEHDGLYYPLMIPRCEPVDDTLDGSPELVTEWTVAFVGGEQVADGDGEDYSSYDTEAMPIDISAGDRLITLDSSLKPSLTPIDTTVYYAPGHGFTDLSGWGNYDEVDGVSLEGMSSDEKRETVRQALEDHGMFRLQYQESYNDAGCWVSEQPTMITVGDYSGTKWEEKDVYIDKPLVVKPSGESVIKLEVTKTHDGYFVIELGDVPAGEYMFSDSSGMMKDFYGYIEWSRTCYRISIS